MLLNAQASRSWHPTPYAGIEYSWLWRNPQGGGYALLRLDAGASLPRHRHPGREQIYVVDGRIMVNAQILNAGDHLILAEREAHQVQALTRAQYLAISEKEGVTLLPSEDTPD
ncbi:cupin domain-containing protein [Affinibrenneria salicis]|uniref:Cupin domain-containing protein n=1 Tax=Affinibrenneria salicis TaxID=2590031 RepID=A0A5J5FWW3_9GAMM|nr:cupin domain-containing protein [Affinibrenneria salicis]KAA8998431.1 cupin domain-containing protein [Affinibrenneria salicis]